jgi:hypothetical protein
VPIVLVDANIEGQAAHIWMRMQSAPWQEFTLGLDISFRTLAELGLDVASRDEAVWRFCQEHGHYLLTSNRNADSEDSLEATLRREGSATSLPVFTLSAPDRVFHDRPYLEDVVEKLFDYIMSADNILGTGRLYLP